ncbi:MAG TPA: GGDEF domain-containing response regulator, partial [Stenotrophomonas sp.]|nr:GGDEF domain-containing response regulator [Stenotrophomonas sp.]
MVARHPAASTARDDTRGRARGSRAETPPADYWRRWDDISEQIGGVRPQSEAGATPRPTPPAVTDTHATAAPARATQSPSAPTTPVHPAPPAATHDGDEALLRPGDSPYRILIVEDDRSQALFAQSVL